MFSSTVFSNFLYFIICFYLTFIANMQLSGYVSSVGQIIEVDNKWKEQKVVTTNFDFYFHTKDQVRRGVCFSPQEEENPEINWGWWKGMYFEEMKFASEEKYTDFTLGTNSGITSTKLPFEELEHVLNYSSISRWE